MNEPDLNGWTPDSYFPYLKAVYTAIKQVDPNAVVIHAGMWTGWNGVIAWYERMYQLGAKPYFDAANVHAYDDPNQHGSWSMWDMTWGSGGRGYYDSKNVRSVMNANGDSAKPIVSTESGGPVPKYSEAQQAQIVTNALKDGRFAFVCVYNMMDDEVPGFGLLRSDRSKRPSWDAYHAVATS